jgi:hypothetical protein
MPSCIEARAKAWLATEEIYKRPNKIIINFKDVKFNPEYNIIPKVSKIADNVSKIETE